MPTASLRSLAGVADSHARIHEPARKSDFQSQQHSSATASLRPISSHFAEYGYLNKRQIFIGNSYSEITRPHRHAYNQRSRRATRLPSGHAQELGPRR